MAKQVFTDLSFNGGATVTGLPTPIDPGDAAPKSYVDNAVEGLAWKDNVRVSTQGDLNLSAPGATIDGIALAVGDRVLVRQNTTATQNGMYVWNGAAVVMGRSSDASTGTELNNAIVAVDQGTDAGTSWRCSTVNAVVGTDAITFEAFAAAVPAASESTAGKAEIATQAEVDGGTDDLRIVTPAKLAAWTGRLKRVSASIGDGTATQFDITHNLGTRDVTVAVYRNSSPYDEVIADVGHLDINTTRITFAAAPTSNQYRVVVVG
mgnify:CR=1 FL=1